MGLPQYPSLKGQIAVVVGGVGACGRSVVQRLAQEGAIAVVADLNDTESAEVAATLAGEELPVEGMGIDVTSPDSVEAAFALVTETYGPPTILCYGVGFHLAIPVLETTPAQWRYGIDSNLVGAWLCTREFLLRHEPTPQRPASVLYLLSELGGNRNDALTAVTLAGIEALARTVERNNIRQGLRAGVLISGPLPGSGAERVFREQVERGGGSWQEFLCAWAAESPAPLTCDPGDVADAVVRFVCRTIESRDGHVFRVTRAAAPDDPGNR